MRALPKLPRPRSLLIGTENRDDAAVVRLDKTRALVATVDFFAPVVDDPRDYGAIAAANAISDVYAMGGKPLYALSVVGFPREGGHWDVLGEILAGGAEKAHEAGCPIVGGHSIDDAEPKYGLAVTGLVHPDRILANSGAKQGDVLLLTKALGTGIATTAIKKGIASKELVLAAVEQMKTLNKAAGEVFARSWKNVHALTDVTGFGLLGHLDSLLRASDVRAAVRADAVRVLPGVRALAAQGVVPGGSKANLEFLLDRTQLPAQMSEADRLVLADAQTNGGLLAAVSEKAAPRILKALADAGAPAVELGIVLARGRRSPGIDVIGALAG
jgi:selenide, water dikinase